MGSSGGIAVPAVIETGQNVLLVDQPHPTIRPIQAHRPDLVVLQRQEKRVMILAEADAAKPSI